MNTVSDEPKAEIPVPKNMWPICPVCRKTVKSLKLVVVSDGWAYLLGVNCCEDLVVNLHARERVGEHKRLFSEVEAVLMEYEKRAKKIKLSRKGSF